MKRSTVNFIIDSAGLLVLIALAISGFVLQQMPHGPGHGGGWQGGRGGQVAPPSFWSLSRHQWGDVHLWVGVLFLVLVVLHVLMHWNWLVRFFKSQNDDSK